VKFKSVKKSAEVALAGIKVDIDFVDGSIKAVNLTDANGAFVRITERGYNLYVEIPAPPETEKKYQLKGSVLGLPVDKLFDDEFSANQEKNRLSSETHDSDLKVEAVQVPVAA
jgi:hypothetical protein